MTDKEKQSVELLERVRARLMKGHFPHLIPKAADIVVGFLLCHEELQKMQTEQQK